MEKIIPNKESYSLSDVDEEISAMLSCKVNDMTKIKLKCWHYHCSSRIKNGNTPYKFNDFTRRVGKLTYLDYIHLESIDFSDIGGKEKAIAVVEKWYN